MISHRKLDILGHIELCSDFLFSAELHDEVLIPCLALTNRITEAELSRGIIN